MTNEEYLLEFIAENDISLHWLQEVGHKYVNYKRVIDDKSKISYDVNQSLKACMTERFQEKWNLFCNMKGMQGPIRITQVADYINSQWDSPVKHENLEYVYSSPDGVGYTRVRKNYDE